MRVIIDRSTVYTALWMATLAIPFSSLGSQFLLKFGGRFLPEPFIVIWIAFFASSSQDRFRATRDFLLSKPLWVSTFLLTFFAAIGMARNDVDLAELYSSFRSALALLVGFLLCDFHQRRGSITQFLDLACLFIIFATFYTLSMGFAMSGTKTSISGLGLMLCTLFYLDRQKLGIAIVVLMFLAAGAILSFFRQNYAYVGLASLYILSVSAIPIIYNLLSLKAQKKDFTTIILFSAAFLLTLSQAGAIYSWLAMDASRYAQTIHKFNQMMALGQGGGNRSDFHRFDGIMFFVRNLEYYILPNGLVNQSSIYTWSLWGGGIFTTAGSLILDSGFAYIIGQFGAIFFAGLLFFLLKRAVSIIATRGAGREKFRTLLLQSAFVIPLFLDGGAFTQIERSFTLGIAIAMAFPRRSALRISRSD